ncbi:MAG: RHS repeat-associated core domain-containing protein, partial [Bacteroidetes bacterium]|nr:RHS repeat-associated core domain-containing protein [Bacteroidota bacterium]
VIASRSYNLSSTEEKYKFTEKERDTESGYDYFGARYYDAELGRWMSVDPIAYKAPGYSPYNYAFNNPLKYTDPDGRFPFVIPAVAWAVAEAVGVSIAISAIIYDKIANNGEGFGAKQVNIGTPTTTSPSTEISGTVNLEHPGTFIDNGSTSVPADATNVGGNTETLIDQGISTSETTQLSSEGARKKPGSLGKAKGRDALRAENKQAQAAGKAGGLKPGTKQWKIYHNEISGQGYKYKQLQEVAKRIKDGEY